MTQNKSKLNIFWFRRDLRLDDNAGLYHALISGLPVLPVFIFDTNILNKLQTKSNPRVTFIYEEVTRLKNSLEKTGSSILVKYGDPAVIFRDLIMAYDLASVFANHDYEPYALQRDSDVQKLLEEAGIIFKSFKDQVIFEKDEVLKDNGGRYTVFTPYSRKWKSELSLRGIPEFLSENLFNNFLKTFPIPMPEISALGFVRADVLIPSREVDVNLLKDYHLTRDFPAVNGTSKLSVHLRFGTISIRKLVKKAVGFSDIYLNELIWREFYMMILWYYPNVVDQSFKPQYDRIRWKNDERRFEAWRNGMTGYPVVDAGMREMNSTGYMHNRVRMITASFLTKHLLTDWRWGEAYFAEKLLDYELASNNGGWQWAAGTGCDAAPYFRVFNPALQSLKFDPEKKYIRKWVPELDSARYPHPIVDHAIARNEALDAYKRALK